MAVQGNCARARGDSAHTRAELRRLDDSPTYGATRKARARRRRELDVRRRWNDGRNSERQKFVEA